VFDHLGLPVSDYERSKRFYERVMASLGYGLVMEASPEQAENGQPACGFGPPGRPAFWIGREPGNIASAHVGFEAATRAQVHAFHAAGLAAGGRDNGAPGPRPHYGPHYYAAFVLDPDGHNIEAVCQAPEPD
jgi:catechol 2,3-dioxygenase-like lactoylglutathione lyase family enzyme